MTKTETGIELLPLDSSLGYQVRVTHRLIQRFLQSQIETRGVPIGTWYFLRVLWMDDGLTQRELSERVGTQEPTTMSAIRGMERSGLVRRERNAEDGRKINVFLTDRGRALKDELMPMAKQVVDEAAAGFSPEERQALIDMLQRIQRNIQERTGA